MRASTKGSAGSRDDESVPQARKHSRMVRVPESPVCQQMSLPPPPAYESTPHRQPAHCPELDGSIITPATSSGDPVEAQVTHHTEGGGHGDGNKSNKDNHYRMAQRMDAFEEKMDELLMLLRSSQSPPSAPVDDIAVVLLNSH
ncbi:hypothetical protein AALO_G00091990 [Alosa alosa]|uniref:Uncharacterized protein n=1 Tax=Alosa alosa TaxID=278164 RepID=A0AAV6GRR0_9TELE|nr:hypothetical protein AALO_G00091990 [Alosa alosa]